MSQKRIVRNIGVAAAFVVTLLLSSCLGMEMQTVFNADGSGRMTMKLRVSQMVLEMGSDEAEVDIPLSKDDLVEQYKDIEGVTVVDVSQEETDEDRIITAVIDFEDFNNLSAGDDMTSEDASLEIKDGKSVLRISIGPPSGESTDETNDESQDSEVAQMPPPGEMDESTLAMMQAFMEGYSFEYRIVAPTEIASYSHGELQADGRTLVYTMPMGEFILVEEPFYLEVVW